MIDNDKTGRAYKVHTYVEEIKGDGCKYCYFMGQGQYGSRRPEDPCSICKRDTHFESRTELEIVK